MSGPYGQPPPAPRSDRSRVLLGRLDLGGILALAAAALGLIIYLCSFAAGAVAVQASQVLLLFLGAGLLGAAAVLPDAPKVLVPSAVLSALGTLSLLVGIVTGLFAPLFGPASPGQSSASTPGILITILVLGFLQTGALVAAVLAGSGILTSRTGAVSSPQQPWGAQPPPSPGQYPPGQYGAPPFGHQPPAHPGRGPQEPAAPYGRPGPPYQAQYGQPGPPRQVPYGQQGPPPGQQGPPPGQPPPGQPPPGQPSPPPGQPGPPPAQPGRPGQYGRPGPTPPDRTEQYGQQTPGAYGQYGQQASSDRPAQAGTTAHFRPPGQDRQDEPGRQDEEPDQQDEPEQQDPGRRSGPPEGGTPGRS